MAHQLAHGALDGGQPRLRRRGLALARASERRNGAIATQRPGHNSGLLKATLQEWIAQREHTRTNITSAQCSKKGRPAGRPPRAQVRQSGVAGQLGERRLRSGLFVPPREWLRSRRTSNPGSQSGRLTGVGETRSLVASHNRTWGSVSVLPGSCQLVQQRLGVLQVGGVEALGEPAVDRGEQVARLVALALVTP
jgi:hypothetical protein